MSIGGQPSGISPQQLYTEPLLEYKVEGEPPEPVFDESFFDLDPTVYYTVNGNSCGFLPSVPIVPDESNQIGFQQFSPSELLSIDVTEVNSPDTQRSQKAESGSNQTLVDEREQEMSFLVTHFTRVIGPWLDLFDISRYFTYLVPLKALRSALLRYAVAALAAKQLGRLAEHVSQTTGHRTRHSISKVERTDASSEWFYKAANYYDKAISCLRMYLQAMAELSEGLPDSSATARTEDSTVTIAGSESGETNKRPRLTRNTSSPANAEDLLAAISILCLYEFLDNYEREWSQ